MTSRATFTLGQYIFLCVAMFGYGAWTGACIMLLVLR